MKERTNNYEHITYKGEPAYLIEKGSVVSTVSRVPRDDFKTNINNISSREVYKENNNDDCDDFEESNYCTAYESNCEGADIPNHIDASTAHFDEEGNYEGGYYKDESEY